MTRKGRSFQWTPECQEAFEHLKAVLTSAPILAMPDEDSTFTLDTDAAISSIGAVLSQTQYGLERVVAYASRKLSKAEMNYCVTRRELLAVVYFVKYFKHYLLGRKFVVRTDHSALQWLKKLLSQLDSKLVGLASWRSSSSTLSTVREGSIKTLTLCRGDLVGLDVVTLLLQLSSSEMM